jgi:hypothetical protein
VNEARFIELANRVDALQLISLAMAMAFSAARHGMPCDSEMAAGAFCRSASSTTLHTQSRISDSLMAFERRRKPGRIFVAKTIRFQSRTNTAQESAWYRWII